MKTTWGMKLSGRMGRGLAGLVLGAMTAVMPVIAQTPAPSAMGTVHGAIKNPAGMAIKAGDVKFAVAVAGSAATNPKDLTYKFTFPIDANGNYKATDLPPGGYIAVVWSEGKAADFMRVDVKPGDDKTVDFDMTREEYMKTLSETDRKALEEYKKKNSAVTADNAKIQNINGVLAKALADQKSGKPDDAVSELQGVMDQRPNEPILWAALAQAQLASADLAFKTNKSDPAVTQKYADSATSYQKAIDLSNASSKKPEPAILMVYYQNLGSGLVKSGKVKEGEDAYDQAAKANPPAAGKVYYNEAANLYNLNKTDDAATAAERSIAADPKFADAYYIKAQGMVQHATVDSKTQKVVLPPGCLEAYQEYLELSPDGQHAQEVKDLLANLGQPIKNSFKAPGKKG